MLDTTFDVIFCGSPHLYQEIKQKGWYVVCKYLITEDSYQTGLHSLEYGYGVAGVAASVTKYIGPFEAREQAVEEARKCPQRLANGLHSLVTLWSEFEKGSDLC